MQYTMAVKLVFPRKSWRTSSISSSYPAVEAGTELNLQLNIENLNDSFIMKYDDVRIRRYAP